MKLPRHVDGDELARLLSRYGYRIVHQTGSHQRLSAVIAGKTHDLMIPIINLYALAHCIEYSKMLLQHHQISREQIIAELFG